MKILTTIAAVLCATTAFAQSIEVSNAYARSAGPSAKTGAAFMIINNTGEEDVTLIGGMTDFAKRAEIHTHNMTAEGVMQMTEVEGGLLIPVGQCVLLERGGYHVMMLGLTKPMVDGEMLDLSLEFKEIDPIALEVKIDSQYAEPADPMLPEGRESCLSAHDAMDMGDMQMDSHDGMAHDMSTTN